MLTALLAGHLLFTLASLVTLSDAEVLSGSESGKYRVISYSGDDTEASHWAFGVQMGMAVADEAKQRFAEWSVLQKQILPYIKTQKGAADLAALQATHKAAFPRFMEELKGIAQGTGLPFDWVFAAQLAQELGSIAGGSVLTAVERDERCSDSMVCSESSCVDGHNEDNGAYSLNRTFVVNATLGTSRFVAFTYAGELPTGAYGANSAGIAFSLNKVEPPLQNRHGLGRGFVSRSVLEAGDLDSAVKLATVPGQALGHNFQLMDFCARTIVNLEVAGAKHSVRHIGAEAFFHANQYETLIVPGQSFSNSSSHRLARAAQLPAPHDLTGVLGLLGDQGDREWPIFHDEASHARGDLSDWTISSAAFNLDRKVVELLEGNPNQHRVAQTWWIGKFANCSSSFTTSILV
eukprot:gnl/TRDRNA2_/TRDRNA2_200409_c0_seq1.p1 gnl/TRDRNA2_/TRDRNA2_200409_c0~~gnl/TRDRNA2_/TRDRNA2_200409_c0_seq1.p1  ORF type:complete len:406 (+),score=63.45 gnl/TRDRNA2_/TRDRNA2_200409_c0_seq1:140-1357(+)